MNLRKQIGEAVVKKKIIAAILSAAMALCLMVGCDTSGKKPSGGANKEYKEEVPVYTTDEEFYLGMWIGVPSQFNGVDVTDEEFEDQFRLIKEAGFNYTEGGYAETSVGYNKRALAAAEKYDLNMLVYDDDIRTTLINGTITDEQAERQLKQLLPRYSEYKSFAGLKIKDEPAYSDIASYHTAKTRFDKVLGDEKMFYMNLLPALAGPAYVTADYREYIREYVRQIDTPYVSYDQYPLKQSNKGKPYILRSFLYNMQEVRAAAPGKDMYTFLLATEHTGYRGLTSVADATFQTYSFLAYGGKGIQWFCYGPLPEFDGTSHFKESCIGRDGKPTEIYDYIKTANLEIRAFEHIYNNFEWKGVMTTIGSENDNGGENENFAYLSDTVTKHDRIVSLKTTQDTLTGIFEDGDGRDGFMIVNFTEPTEKRKNKVELTLKDASRAIIVKNGKEEVVDTDANDKLTFTMNEGEGYFVIPLK